MKKELSFEELIKKLEKITEELENGDLSLDETVDKFEEGIKISKQCSKTLDEAEKRITILLKEGDNIKEENFIQEEE